MVNFKLSDDQTLATIHLKGILSSDSVQEFDNLVSELNMQKLERIKVYMDELQLITSVGIRSLIHIYRESENNNVDFWLVSPRKQILEVLEVVDLLTIMQIAGSDSEIPELNK